MEDKVREIQRRLIDSVNVTATKPSATISTVVLNDVPTTRTLVYKERHTTITSAELSERWLIGLIQATDTPKKFWDYGMRWVCQIQQRTHLRSNRIDGGIPLEKLTGETQDISEYLDFGFYDRV